MKAVGVFAFGGPEALRVVDVSEPHAGLGEVRIRVHAVVVSPASRTSEHFPAAQRHAGPPSAAHLRPLEQYMKKIGVGIIGASTGGWASISHVPALKALSDYELRAISITRRASA
ncbi:hypothetical protein AB0M44_34585 [Streptosporangium subroseum]|uniref:hypothetical protein n=1 Tax=Streptosporangium subroseum TaxID=106412 RepID=UPI003416E856